MTRVQQKSKRKPPAPLLPAATRRLLSEELGADYRTIEKIIRGQPVRGMVGIRVQAGLARILEDLQAAAVRERKP